MWGALADERARLERLAPDFSSDDGFNARMIDYCFRSIRPWVEGVARCIEMGCSDGRMTGQLAAVVGELTAVDGTRAYVEAAAARHPNVTAVCSLFEELVVDEPFDAAVLGHVLEPVADPVVVLGRARVAVRPGGRVIVTVPNADSLHRAAGVAMGMLEHKQQLNASDLRIGHRRVYTRDELVADVESAGLRPVHAGGIFLKPLADAQIERDWPDELIEAYYLLGERHPEICANLLVVAERDG
jgi:2-polyprenyl-3-methyl-5-hydroxy-6-metoxy-1,4-benzoquinol methylase